MKMKHSKFILLVMAMIAVTGMLAAAHLTTRADAEPGCLVVATNGEETRLPWDAMPLVPVAGEVVNGRGEVKQIDARGIALRDALALVGVEAREKVTVVADDEYRAEIAAAELDEPGKVWLTLSDDGLRLIVFGDANSKRNVRDVARVEVE